ncbi:ATP-binding protein [Streptomyces paludis]|uniref:ATP-binding protein n=1 Tax=Streptomyces paludis TaxID=2282738 RepID=A0A345HQ20_9ACTN|nr:ATP-binding protein [Streptomyces paludis]AXG78794.1 ATP-binding protein [Streptomyces paludis]
MNHDGEQRDQYDQYDRSRLHDHCVTFQLPGHPRSVSRARDVLRRDFGLPGEPGDTAALLLSELVTNALRHGSPRGREIAVTLLRVEGLLRLEVEDAGECLPRPRVSEPDDECGRGLALIDALATDWGVAPRSGPGKRVWATLEVAGRGDPGAGAGAGMGAGVGSGVRGCRSCRTLRPEPPDLRDRASQPGR